MSALPETVTPATDVASCEWLRSLRAEGATRNEAIERLHALLLRAAGVEAARRRRHMPHVRDELEEIAYEAAGDALISVLARLDDFRGESRFTTWAYKFAVLETAVKLRKRAWQGRELPLEPEAWNLFSGVTFAPDAAVEQGEMLSVIQTAVADVLTPRQRQVLVAVVLNGVPIDVMADRLDTTRGALYKTLHDARRKLREHLEGQDLYFA
jgi:RNA polymerase sigma-70 factor (ECF subfamily)